MAFENSLTVDAVRASSTKRLRGGWQRLRKSALPILQCAAGAAIAWYVAQHIVGHSTPYFAPVAAVISIGIAFGARIRRAVELVAGVSVGIGIGDLFISHVGTGPWQIALVVAVAMGAAIFLDGGAVIPMQAASSAVLVATLYPPHSSGAYLRVTDSLIGGLVGVAVVAIFPLHPVRRARQQAADILAVIGRTLTACADGLHEQDAEKIHHALESARATQPQIDALRNAVAGGREISRISPLYWNARPRLDLIRSAVNPLDNAVRNTRVLLRRALSLVRDDEILDSRIVEEVEELGQAVEVVRQYLLTVPGGQPDAAEATRVLRRVAKGATIDLVSDAGLSAHVVFAQLRSILVDLMQVCGVKRLSALALLPPTVEHPYVEPAD